MFAPSYIETLIRVTARVNESCVISENDLLKTAKWKNIISFFKSAKNFLTEFAPEIVHIHAAWNLRAAMIAALAARQGCFVVVSPHGGMSQSIINLDFWKEKFLKIITYQYALMTKADAIISVTEREFEELKSLGWNNNVSLIPHPEFKKISDEALSETVTINYRRILDSNYHKLIRSNEKLFVARCVTAALYPAGKQLPEDILKDINIENIQYRRIFIYAHNNNVTDLMLKGAERLKLTIPTRLNVESLNLYKIKKRECIDFVTCSNLCKVIKKVIHGIEITPQVNDEGQISLITLAEIYESIRFMEYDEDEFEKQVKEYCIGAYTKKLFHEMKSLFLLQDGFIPIIMDIQQ